MHAPSVVVGGAALAPHGSRRADHDLDVCRVGLRNAFGNCVNPDIRRNVRVYA